MALKSTGEASPSNNTGGIQNINPITFDESALARLLDGVGADKGVEDKPKPDPEVQETEAKEAAQDPANADPDVSEATAEDEAHSNSDSEETETTEAETDSEDNQVEPSGVQKRIDKLVARAKAAEEEIERLKQSREELNSRLHEQSSNKAPATVDPSNPLDSVWDYKALEAKRDEMIELRRWCENNAEGYVAKNGTEYSAEQIRQAKYNAEDHLERFIPRRAQFLVEYSQVDPVATQLFPFWKDPASQLYTEANEILRLVPQLKSHPTYKVFIGDYLAGRDARLKAATETAKQKAAPKPAITKAPKQPSAPKAAPVKKDAKQAQADASKSNFYKSGKETELAAILSNFM